jgi:hypothetical protein
MIAQRLRVDGRDKHGHDVRELNREGTRQTRVDGSDDRF